MSKRSRLVRELTCPNCAANLRWNGEARVVECRYCHSHVVVGSGKVTAEPRDVVSRRRPPSRAAWIIGAVVAAAAVGGLAIAVKRGMPRIPGQGPSASPAKVAAAPVASSPQELARYFDAQVMRGVTVSVPMSGDTFSTATFTWKPEHLDHVATISLSVRRDDDPLTDVVARAREQLGRVLRPAATGGYQYSTDGVNLSFSSSAGVYGYELDQPGWPARFDALWTVLRASALGSSDRLDQRVRRDVLGLDYPLTVFDQIAFDVDVDGAAAEVKRVAPGVRSDGENHHLGVDHPWFERAIMRWANEANGPWQALNLWYPPEFDFKARAGELQRCLEPLLGTPTRTVSDHMAGDFSLAFDAVRGVPGIHVSDKLIQIYLHSHYGDPVTADGFHQVIDALAACGS